MPAGLLLAAGAGRRLGGPKAAVEHDGQTLVARGVQLLREGGCDPVLVVLGAEADRLRPMVLDVDAEVVVADGWDEGMGASLRAGLAALPGTTQGCVVALADQPLVGAAAVARLARAWQGGARAAVASYGGKDRNPVLLDRSTWAEVAALAVGDVGARGWLRSHPELVVSVECGDTGDPFDVDTPADLTTLQEMTT